MKVYLDNAATTPMSNEVIEVMTDVMKNNYGNPSSTHAFGRESRVVIENARRSICDLINAEPKEIVFTSCGTESDNMAVIGAVRDLGVKHIISTVIEHHAIDKSLITVDGFEDVKVTYLSLDKKGNIDLNELEEALKSSKSKTLVTLMHANNEIGTLLPIKEVGALCKLYNAYFHSDTVQTLGHYEIDVKALGLDFISCSAHKFHGPKGVGFLYKNKDLAIKGILEGGTQERGVRAGTENIIGIAGMAKAFEMANDDMQSHQKHVQGLKDQLITGLKSKIEGIEVNGETNPDKSLYTVLSVLFPPFAKQDMLLFMLDLEGVACTGGSACHSGANMGSHVLRGIEADVSRASARFSFSRYTTKEEIDYTIEKIVKVFNS